MSSRARGTLSRKILLDYFLAASTPRERWLVGMELEKMGRRTSDGRALPYDGASPSVLDALQSMRELRGGDPVLEAERLIGVEGSWGAISLEPGGQVEWSSPAVADLDALESGLARHLEALDAIGRELGIRWLDVGVDPELPLETMPWMPKARYAIMRPFLGARGRLAHRMMTQTASIQCAFDYSDADDWTRKFRAAALLTPTAVALFANSPRMEGRDTGYASFRQQIWRETDPARCGLPSIVFDPGFGPEAWLDWVLDVPTMFVRRARGYVPLDGLPFRGLLERDGCSPVKLEDWEAHISTVFTEVRSYNYIEVRSADLQPDDLALAVPAFWTGILYHGDALAAALELGRPLGTYASWSEALAVASREGLARQSIADLAAEAVAISMHGLRHGAACAGAGGAAVRALERLAERRRLAEKRTSRC
jgi:glutamate--cysteine ligase